MSAVSHSTRDETACGVVNSSFARKYLPRMCKSHTSYVLRILYGLHVATRRLQPGDS